MADKLRGLSQVLDSTNDLLNTVQNYEQDVDSKEDSIEDFLKGRDPSELSRQELDQLEEMLGEEGQEIEGEVERMEKAINNQQQVIEYLNKYEQAVGSEEQRTFKKLEKVKGEIRGLNQKMSHQTVDKAIGDLENAVAEMSQEADQILGAAKVLAEMEQTEGSEFQLESHLEEEVKRFDTEVNKVEQLVNYVGGEQESEYASKIEEMRQQIDEEVKTENRQIRQEIQEEEELVEQIKQEAQRYQKELEEAYEEAQSVEQRIQGSQGFQNEENELGKIINQLEKEKEEADKAIQMIQQDESFLSRLMS
jgi:ABC-type transporter Mla subunit MlaD